VPETATAIDVVVPRSSGSLGGECARPSIHVEDPLPALKIVAIRGTVWNVSAYAAAMFLRLLSNILLSRLLAPQYFGLMTLLNIAITGLNLFSDFGITPNIVRSERGDDPAFLNTAWTMQVLRGCTLWLVCLVLSAPFAAFYREPQLLHMAPVIGLCLIISSFNSTSLSTLARRMAMRELALVELSVQAGQLLFTIGWALFEASVWALIGGRLFADTARLVISHCLLPGQRNSFSWDKEAAHSLFTFGRWVFLSTASMFLASQSDRLILGRLVSLRTLGLYGIAFGFAEIPRQIIMSFCGNIAFPFVAKLGHLPRPEFMTMVLRYRQPLLAVAAGLLALIVNSGDLFMLHIYDHRYHDASWMVPILALGLWHTVLYSTTNSCLLALGKPQYNALGYLLSALVLFVVTPVSFHKWGMVGAVWTVAVSDVPMYFTNLFGLAREGLFPLAQDIKATALFLLFCGLLVLLRLAAGLHFPHAAALW
jgi:O-antigen/teichoic acid export membrane protein